MNFDSVTQQRIRDNEANWDARVPVHVASRFYGLDGSRTPRSWFGPFEWVDLGDLRDRDVVHLQCHLGIQTIALAQQGARATGLDFSAASIEQARLLARREGVDVDFVHSNVYDAVTALGERSFDVIYTGKGALCYLPDLDRWAREVAGLLRPGGLLYLVEFHPLLVSLSLSPAPGDGPEPLLRHDYLEGGDVIEKSATSTYTDGPPLRGAPPAYEWTHGIGEVVTALAQAGLRIDRLRETELLAWPRWDHMVRDEGGWWRLPPDEPRLPMLYAVRAVKP